MGHPVHARSEHADTGVLALARRHVVFSCVFALGVAARVVLAPLWHGQDFTVWSLASGATLRGADIYSHHPAYPGGPFAYLPLFLDVELPFRFLSDASGLSFTVLGKLPILLADCGVAVVLYATAVRLGCRREYAAVAAAAYFLNPLVLYNDAYYGRFDSIGCLLLLACTSHALAHRVDLRASIWYGLAVTAKTFPLFVLPTILRAAGRKHWITALVPVVVIPVIFCIPYLATTGAVFDDTVVYDGLKTPQGASWWSALPVVNVTTDLKLTDAGLGVFVIGAIFIAHRLAARSLDRAVAATLVLFLACSKVVLEQYLTWPLPWLILVMCMARPVVRYASAAILVALTTLALLDTESFHPFGRTSESLGTVIALVSVGYVIVLLFRIDPALTGTSQPVVGASSVRAV